MRHNFVYGTFNEAIPDLFGLLLDMGSKVPSRNGDTLELAFTGITLRDSLSREIYVPGRKHNLAAQIAETMWVLAGRNDIEWLSQYLPRAVDYSDDGITWRGGYGKRIREWEGKVDYSTETVIDQMEHVIDLLRRDPETRQAVISIYDPNIDTHSGKDIPCNDTLHFLARDDLLDLHIFVRSNDMMWGWSGINVFEWSSLLEIVAGMVGMDAGALHFSVSSFHLYDKHWDKAREIQLVEFTDEDVQRPNPSPRFNPTGLDDMESFHNLCHQWFGAEAIIREQAQRPYHERNLEGLIDEFPEPMLQSWLRVLAWWWTGQMEYLRQLAGTTLFASAVMAMQPKDRKKAALQVVSIPTLIDSVIALHNEKDAAYGNSWCRRGEMLGIMANIARKVDRLGGSETADETSLDTAMDLFVYLAKYRAWIDGQGRDVANTLMRDVVRMLGAPEYTRGVLEATLREQFDLLEDAVVHKNLIRREQIIAEMLSNAWHLVQTLNAEQAGV